MCAGADLHAVDCRGKRPFDYVEDHEDWIDSGHFSDDIRALLKGEGISRGGGEGWARALPGGEG